MSSQTRTPRVVTDIGSLPWVNLQNISATDGSFAYSVNVAGGLCVINLTTDGSTPFYRVNTHYIDTVGGDPSYPSPTGGSTDTWSVWISPAQVNNPNFGIIVNTPGGSFLARDFGFSMPSDYMFVEGFQVNIIYRNYSVEQGMEPWAQCGNFMCNQHQISGVYVTVHSYVPPPTPANISLGATTLSPSSVSPGGTITLSSTLTNTGSLSGSVTVYMYIGGSRVTGNTYTVNGGVTTPISLSYTLPAGSSAGSFSACLDLV